MANRYKKYQTPHGINPALRAVMEEKKYEKSLEDEYSSTGIYEYGRLYSPTNLYNTDIQMHELDEKYSDRFSENSLENDEFYKNVKSPFVTITEDKVKLKIRDFMEKYDSRKKYFSRAATSFSVAATLLVSFFSTEFVEFYLSAETWKVCYILLMVITLLCALYSLIRGFCIEKVDEKTLIESMKKFK